MTIISAIRKANKLKSHYIGWDKKNKEWVICNQTEKITKNIELDLFCIKSGLIPISVSAAGDRILSEILCNNLWILKN